MNLCPERATLQRLVQERLTEAERPTVESHVENCAACQQILKELTASAPVLLAVEPPTIRATTPLAAAPAPTIGELPDVPGFVLREKLGEGGMGVVYFGRDLSLNRDVAVKVLHERLL